MADLDHVEPRPSGREVFRFFDLPAEIRMQILDHLLVLDKTIDIHVSVFRLLSNTLLVSKRFCAEAAASFYGGNTFRILPTHPRAQGKYARPLLQDFSKFHRTRIVSLELRFGPFWTLPPKCWEIHRRLGLERVVNARVLRVFIEVDPSLAIFNGFRSAKLSYSDFCAGLLQSCLDRLPNVEEVQFDAEYSASRGAPMMDRLVELTRTAGKRISWGPYQRAIDQDRARRAMNAGASAAELPSATERQGMIPFYSSSPLYRRSLPKSMLS